MKKLYLIFLILMILSGTFVQIKSQPSVDSLILKLVEADNDTSKVALLNKITREYRMENPKKALEFNIRAFNLARKLNDKRGIARAYELLGTIYYYQSNYMNSLDNYFEAMELFKQLKDSTNIAQIYNCIGLVYLGLEDYQKGLLNYKKALEIYEDIEKDEGLAIILNNIGVIYLKKNLDSLALHYYKRAFEINKKINRKRGVGYASMNIGNIYLKKDLRKKAKAYYMKSLKNFLSIHDLKGLSLSYYNVGNIYLYFKQYDSAKFYLFKSKEIAHKYSLLEVEKRILEGLSIMYEKLDDSDAIINCLNEKMKIQDTLLKISNKKVIQDFEKKIGFEQAMKDQEFELLDKSKRLKINRLHKYILFIILLSGSVIAWVLFNRKRIKIIHFNEKLESKSNELISFAMYILQKNDLIYEFREQLLKLQKRLKVEDNKNAVAEIINSLIFKIAISKDIEMFRDKLRLISDEFYSKLEQKYPKLTQKDKQLATLIRLSFTSKQIGVILDNTTESIETSRYRLRKKMGLTSDDSLKDTLNKI